MFSVYIITNSVNGKQYVGITNTTVTQRFRRHQQLANSSNPRYLLHRAMKKHGVESFVCDEIYTGLTMEEAKLTEIQLIEEHQTFYVDYPSKGYNMTRGGDGIWGYRHSESTRQRLCLVNKGRTYSATHRANISESKVGKPRPAHVQEILRECRAQFCGDNGRGSNNPNAKTWKLTNTKTGEIFLVDDFKKWCAEHDWNYGSACSARHYGDTYKKQWKVETYSTPTTTESVTPNNL